MFFLLRPGGTLNEAVAPRVIRADNVRCQRHVGAFFFSRRGSEVDKKWQLGVLAGAGVVVATLTALGAVALGGTPQERDTVPAGQLVTVTTTPRLDLLEVPAGEAVETATVGADGTDAPRNQAGDPAQQPRAVNTDPVTPTSQPADPAPQPPGEDPPLTRPSTVPPESQPPTLCDGQPCESWDPKAPRPTT